MKRWLHWVSAALIAMAAAPALAKEMAAQSLKLTCNVSGLYADGARISGSGAEEVGIDIRRTADPYRPTVDIRITSNGRIYEASLLHSTRDRVAFAFASDGQIDGVAQTLSLTYEIRLDSLRLKRTLMTLFSSQGNALQSAEGNCLRQGTTAAPAGAAAPAAPAPAAAATAATAPTPDWLVELRRKLKECSGKDPFSQSMCVERVKSRYCANRSVRVTECEP